VLYDFLNKEIKEGEDNKMDNTKKVFQIIIMILCFLITVSFIWMAVIQFYTGTMELAGILFLIGIVFMIPFAVISLKWYKAAVTSGH
jgi:amino acid permease